MSLILVTGGAGFIGSHLVNKLIELNHEVVVVDNLKTGTRDNLNKNASFIEADISVKKTYERLPVKVDYIFHLAAQASNEASCDDPILDVHANAISTLLLLTYAKKVDVKKLIFTSTMGVYEDTNQISSEKSLINPSAFYGIHKRASEEYIRIFSEGGMNTTILRLFNTYGPGQNMTDLRQGMLSIYMSFIKKQLPVQVKGSLKRTRDFVFVSDVVNALILSITNSKTDNKTYNICTGKESTVEEAIKLIIKFFGKNKDYPVEVLENTPRDIKNSYGSFDKINIDTGWKPEVSLEDGIKKMVDWLKGSKE